MHNINFRLWSSMILVAMVLMAATCDVVERTPPKPSDFTKEQREKLGDLIHTAILTDGEEFPILPNVPPYAKLHDFVQLVYNLAAHIPHNDTQSPDDDRWDRDRLWKVTIIDREELMSFVAPGGNLYISTGMLRSLKFESELFYLYAFEISLMNERYLFNKLINEYNTSLLEELIVGMPSPNTPSPTSIAQVISTIEFDQEEVREIDGFAAGLICRSSQYDRTSIREILNLRLNEVAHWRSTRPSYNDRVSYIENLEVDNATECGSLHTLGKYQEYVLDIIP